MAYCGNNCSCGKTCVLQDFHGGDCECNSLNCKSNRERVNKMLDKDKVLYKVEFSGYDYVLAEYPEDAIIMLKNQDESLRRCKCIASIVKDKSQLSSFPYCRSKYIVGTDSISTIEWLEKNEVEKQYTCTVTSDQTSITLKILAKSKT